MKPIKLITIYHGTKYSFEDDYRTTVGYEDFTWIALPFYEPTDTKQSIDEWQQLGSDPSHQAVVVGRQMRHKRIVYYAFMSRDRMLLILL